MWLIDENVNVQLLMILYGVDAHKLVEWIAGLG